MGKGLWMALGSEGEVGGRGFGRGLPKMGVKKGAIWTVLSGAVCPPIR